MSESLAVGDHRVRLSNVPNEGEASLEVHPEVSGGSRDGPPTRARGLPRDHNLAIREALGSYALAKGMEAGLDQARDAIMRLLGDARAQTHEAWRMLDAALAHEAASVGEAEQ
jgi:hypothetical protein